MSPTEHQRKMGYFYAVAAFVFWGLNPVYFKWVAQVKPMEVLAHRIVWSVPLIAIMITYAKGWGKLRIAISSKKVLLTLLVTSTIVAANWLVYIYAIGVGKVLQCSLGYYFNPLFNVVLGMLVLKERLNKYQIIAVVLALLGTINLTIYYGQLPWISLVLPLSFSIYGLLRKTVAIESMPGLFVETSILFPAALAYLVFLQSNNEMAFFNQGLVDSLLLIAAGPVTSLPLMAFTAGSRVMRYSTIGIIQYIGPTLTFFLAVAVFGEEFSFTHLVTFALIWAGLGFFMFDAIKTARHKKI